MDIYNFISLCGVVVLVLFGYALSTNRKAINWHVVIWGIGLQMLFAWFLFVIPSGTKVFLFINDTVVKVMDSSLCGGEVCLWTIGITAWYDNGFWGTIRWIYFSFSGISNDHIFLSADVTALLF